MRFCHKLNCAEEALATCAFNYPARQIWIGPLATHRQPGSYDFCEEHARRFVAPVGWTLSVLRAAGPAQQELIA